MQDNGQDTIQDSRQEDNVSGSKISDILHSKGNRKISAVKIKSVRRVKKEKPVPVYDIINSEPDHNFLVKGKTGSIISHNCAMLDELDFAKGQDASFEKSAILKLYTSVKRRIESRFMRNGLVPGLLFLVSSKNNIYDFLETYINKNRNNPHLYIVDEPIWEVKKSLNIYSGETFNLAVGDRYYPSRILNDNEDVEAVSQNQRVIQVPVEYREAFELDMNTSLADIAGIAIVSASKYFTASKVLDTYREYLHNPFVMEEVSLGFDDDSSLQDFFDESLLPKSNRGTQSYHIHWDVSKNGDRTGLSMTTSMDKKKVNRIVKGELTPVIDVMHKIVFAVGISAMPGQEIPFYKIREFVYYLRDIGFNIATITCDSYQCLPASAKIKTDKGDKRIVDLTSEDKVLSYDTDKKDFLFTDFKNLRKTGVAQKMYRLRTFEGQEVICTGNHPLLTDKGYIRADMLKEGDIVVSFKEEDSLARLVFIASVEVLDTPDLDVYDIEVPEYHNFVLDNGIVVHNSVDSIQQFKLQGFDAYTLSVDRSRAPYDALKNAVNEGRLIAPQISLLEKEYLDVEDDRVKGKIDHTPNGCLTGDTEVLLGNWLHKPIKDLIEGEDMIMAYDIEKKKAVPSPFTSLRITRKDYKIYGFITERCGKKDIMSCTGNHPVLTADGYKEAEKIFDLSKILVFDGKRALSDNKITETLVLYPSACIPVYDIEVPGYNNFILKNGMIVHNSKDILDSVAANVYKAGLNEAPPITSNTAKSLILLNDREEEEEENWLLPKGITIIDNSNYF